MNILDILLDPKSGILYIYLMYFGWSFLKIFLYAIPVLSLINMRSRSPRSDKIDVFLLLVPVIEIIAYFYIISNVIPHLSREYKDTFLSNRCIGHGVAAGVLNVFIVTRLMDLIVNYSVLYTFGYNPYIIILNTSIITAGLIMTVSHLKLLHELKIGLILHEIK